MATLDAPVILTGGLRTAPRRARAPSSSTGAAAVMLARGSLGNPWLFEQAARRAGGRAHRDEVLAELDWVIDRAVEHLGPERAGRYLRKFYPWYLERLARGQGAAAGAAGHGHDRARRGRSCAGLRARWRPAA